MSGISTHILDTSRGLPAPGVAVTVEREEIAGTFAPAGGGTTDSDGRVKSLLGPGATLSAGTYRLKFETGAYFAARGVASFYPRVEVTFTISDPSRHHHVPLLLSPFGYTTYRGT